MLNFYNYFRKIHPELANRLGEIDRKLNLIEQSTNDTLIIRVNLNDFEGDENLFAKGEVIFTDSFGANSTIKLSEEQALRIIRDIKVIIIYHDYGCKLIYKIFSNVGMGVAHFGSEDDGIELSNNTLIRKLPS